jgi:nucleoid DNA-binding protein
MRSSKSFKSEISGSETNTIALISGFGKFSDRKRGERRGRNPRTDESMMLAFSK